MDHATHLFEVAGSHPDPRFDQLCNQSLLILFYMTIPQKNAEFQFAYRHAQHSACLFKQLCYRLFKFISKLSSLIICRRQNNFVKIKRIIKAGHCASFSHKYDRAHVAGILVMIRIDIAMPFTRVNT